MPDQDKSQAGESGEEVTRDSLLQTLESLRAELSAEKTVASERIAQLEDCSRQAREADASKAKFIAIMGHELRTPLNAIIGFSEMMEQEIFGPIGNPQYNEYLAIIRESGQHLLSIVNDVLEISKAQTGEYEMLDERLSVPELIDSVFRLVASEARKHNVRLEQQVGNDLPLLLVDKRAMRQILVNLLTNAIKFSDAESHVTVVSHSEAGGGVCVQVIDTGCGIAENQQERIFNAFSQADDGLDRKHEGSGLGLTIARDLTERHDGRLELKSTLGAGTVVSLYLPPSRVLNESLSDEETLFDDDLDEAPDLQQGLRLRHGGQVKTFFVGSGDFVIGRNRRADLNLFCDLIVEDRRVSRPHARLVHEDGDFFLIDQSRHSTFIRHADGSDEKVSNMVSQPLRGTGIISLGVPVESQEESVRIEFEVFEEATERPAEPSTAHGLGAD